MLATSRIALRRFEASDLDAVMPMMGDAETMRYTGFKTPRSVEEVKLMLSQWHDEGTGPLGVWAVVERQSGALVGWAMLKQKRFDAPELGYMIVKAHWGKGYATEIAGGLIAYARDQLKLPKIFAVTSVENRASIKVLESNGMIQIALRPELDGALYSIEF